MLYIVATPIGNLGDITLRALETLREVDVVISEDTRKTGMLLKHFDIKKPQISFREDNETQALPKVIRHLLSGENAAIVTDAGTPCISDPGFILVREALANDIEVSSIPGPTALITALTLSGLPVHSFTFRGFPPRKSGQRQRFFAVDKDSPHTLIFYESPHRLLAFLKDALEVFGDRSIAVCNDLTKKFEGVTRGRISDMIAKYEAREPHGEYVVIINAEGSKVEFDHYDPDYDDDYDGEYVDEDENENGDDGGEVEEIE